MDVFLKEEELKAVNKYSKSIDLLMDLDLINQKNVTGSLGEHYAERYFNKTNPKLGFRLEKKSTAGYDATDKNGLLYQIKAITGSITGSFRILNFDYLILVIIDKNDYLPNKIYKFDKNEVLDKLHYRKNMNSYELRISKKILSNYTPLYEREEDL